MSREKRKAKKEAEKRLSTRQFIGAKEITDYSLVTYGQGELVYFIVKPTNISVLSESSVGARIYALMTVLKGVAEIEMLCLNSRESFEDNKRFLKSQMEQEENPVIRRLLEQFMKYAGFDKETAQKGIEYYRERYSEKGMYENTVYPGVENTLAELKRRGYRMAVASAKPTFYVTQIMDHFNLSRYFEVIAGTDLNGPKVTKSQVIEEALERMSFSDHRDQVIMVGDREHDILGARRCGIQCVAVSYGYGSIEELEKAQPLQIVASADELLNFFV